MIYFFDTCRHIIRTLPALQHDETKPEDLDTTMEDHAADSVRYGCMSRPWTTKPPDKTKKRKYYTAAQAFKDPANEEGRRL